MRRFLLLPPPAAALLVALAAVAVAAPQPIERRITHPDGVSLQVQSIEVGDASIVLGATIANRSEREVSLNRGHGFVLDDGVHGIYHLSPPADNPELRIAPKTQVKAELIFIGPLAAAARTLTLSTNRGIGTRDNPYDDAPLLEATLPLAGRSTAAGAAASHPNGTALLLRRILAGPAVCVASLVATNGNNRTIVLNQDRSLVLADSSGNTAPLRPPAENRELVVPAGTRLDADLAFDCRDVRPDGGLSLVTNRGTGGTADNPYDATPVLTLKGPVERSDATPTPAESHANVMPIARSHLFGAVAAAADVAPAAPSPVPPSQPAPPASAAPAATQPPLSVAGKPAAPQPDAGRPAAVTAPKTLPQLEAALNAEKTDRGLRLVMPADALFAMHQATLDAAAPPLTTLGALVAAMQPREIVVIGHTDSIGKDDANLTLSKDQAHAVAAWLAAHAAKQRPHFIEQGYGRTRPVAANHNPDGSDSPQGQASNRRLEILLRH